MMTSRSKCRPLKRSSTLSIPGHPLPRQLPYPQLCRARGVCTRADAKGIGKELGVRYVLEGSVQREANRVRVNAQLIDAESGAHLWADRFEEDLADVFKLQDQIVARLGNALGFELVKAEAEK